MKNSVRIKAIMRGHLEVPELTQLTTAVLSQWNLMSLPVSKVPQILQAVTTAYSLRHAMDSLAWAGDNFFINHLVWKHPPIPILLASDASSNELLLTHVSS